MKDFPACLLVILTVGYETQTLVWNIKKIPRKLRRDNDGHYWRKRSEYV